jgi:hypothetical protein
MPGMGNEVAGRIRLSRMRPALGQSLLTTSLRQCQSDRKQAGFPDRRRVADLHRRLKRRLDIAAPWQRRQQYGQGLRPGNSTGAPSLSQREWSAASIAEAGVVAF